MATKHFLKSSIKHKFLLYLSSSVLLFVGIVTVLSFFGAKKELEKNVRNQLEILSQSIYQTMTNSMLTGSPEVVIGAEEQAKKLKNITYLNIAKSKQIIRDFNLHEPFTNDPALLKVFLNKKPVIHEIHHPDHQMQILKPFIAKERCLSCHTSAKKGDVLGVMDLRVSLSESDANISYFTTMMSLSNFLMAVVLLGGVLFLLNRLVTNPLEKMIEIIKGLSSGNQDLTKRVNLKSDDELGEIAKNFNRYLDSIEAGHKEERKFIIKAQKTIELAKQGCYSERITAKTDSQTLEEFKNSVNEMLQATKHNFDQVNTILQQYAQHDYTPVIELSDIKEGGAFDILVKHINRLRNVITEMLVENKKTSMQLNRFSDTLLQNVQTVDQTTLKTENSLQNVTESLSHITKNITSNTRNVVQMSKLAQNVTTSAKEGESLANKTANAMEEINEQVRAINEAITVIDQIAFQTNILSLNAAVEAATAGDAGKGFAVVASEVRNLAAKSAEAARKIKELVEHASEKSKDGKEIADTMIEGYLKLIDNISDTVKHIHEIEVASQEQSGAIESINQTVHEVAEQTKLSAQITQKTKQIALKTDQMAKYAVKKIDEKTFDGKNSECTPETSEEVTT